MERSGTERAGGASPGEAEIGAAELKERLDRGDAIALVDVREPYEWRIANLEEYGATLIPMGELEARIGELDPERETVLICRSGHRSGDVTRYLRQRGFDRALNLRGGMLAWGREVDPSVPRY